MANSPTTNLNAAPTSPHRFVSSLASFNRGNDTTVYTALDTMLDEASKSLAGYLVFPATGKSGIIRSARLVYNDEVTETFELYLFNAPPAVEVADNDAFSLTAADSLLLIDIIQFPTGLHVDHVDVDVYPGRMLRDPAAPIDIPFSSSTEELYGLLKLVTGHTPAASTPVSIMLGIERSPAL